MVKNSRNSVILLSIVQTIKYYQKFVHKKIENEYVTTVIDVTKPGNEIDIGFKRLMPHCDHHDPFEVVEDAIPVKEVGGGGGCNKSQGSLDDSEEEKQI